MFVLPLLAPEPIKNRHHGSHYYASPFVRLYNWLPVEERFNFCLSLGACDWNRLTDYRFEVEGPSETEEGGYHTEYNSWNFYRTPPTINSSWF